MKKFTTLFSLMMSLLGSSVFAQSSYLNYQSIIRDNTNQLLQNTSIGIKYSIIKNSPTGIIVYSETQSTTTNNNGLITAEIGSGTVVTGNYNNIDWSDDNYYIKTEIDPNGNSAYSITTINKLNAVPYAQYAKNLPKGDNLNNVKVWDGVNWINKNIFINTTGNGQPINIEDPYLTVNFCIATSGTYPSRPGQYPFLGEIMMVGFNFAPVGYEFCNGQLLSIAQYSALFSLLGTMYGGDGNTTFALPNFQGRSPKHFGTSNFGQQYNIGESGGSATISLINSQLPNHSHQITFN